MNEHESLSRVEHRNGGVRPFFVFSLPRSGSTLLQRMLTAHPDIASASEPWVLIPPMYTLRENGAYTEYEHHIMVRSIRDFSKELPGGIEDYVGAVRNFALDLYGRLALNGERYFLDKTPPYHLIADEVLDLFPDAPLIFLWRNPLSVVTSLVQTYGKGTWAVHRYAVHLFQGLDNLVRVGKTVADRSCMIRYEDMLQDPEAQLRRVFGYLDLPYRPEVLERFREVRPTRGDTAGMRRYGELSREPLEKWKVALATPIRKAWSRRYLRWVGRERLEFMGYDLDELLEEVDRMKARPTRLVTDSMHIAFGVGLCAFNSRLLKRTYRAWPPPPGRNLA